METKNVRQHLEILEKERGKIGGPLSRKPYSRQARNVIRKRVAEGYDAKLLYWMENVYLLKDLMEKAIYESFYEGRITVPEDAVRKCRRFPLERGFEILGLWTEWAPELIRTDERFIYDVMIDGMRRNRAMHAVSVCYFRNKGSYIYMRGLLYPQNDVDAFKA